MIDNLKRKDIDKDILLKSKIIKFLEDNNLELDWISNFSQVIYHYKNNLISIPLCYCGKSTNFKSSIVGYRKTCSFICSNNSKDKKDKIKEANNIEKIKEFWNNADVQYMMEFVNKIKNTKLKKYGDENYNNSYKMFLTKFEKYGFYYNNTEKTYNTKLINGVIKSGDILKDWNLYKRDVKSITRKNKKSLYENWDGTDYYDGELIKGYLSNTHTHRFFPTIDHKISVYYGYINKIDPNIIGSIDNLCITKRFINSIKNSLIEEEFISKYQL